MIPAQRNPRTDRAKFELRATGVKMEAANALRSGIHTRGYLPHVKREGASYFVTFRLIDSLPREFLLKAEEEKAERLHRLYAQQEAARKLGKGFKITEDIENIEKDFRRKVERFLDTGHGACWLRRPEIADIVAGAIRFFEGQRYRLDAWVVMPNHAHAVLWPMPNDNLSAILQSWKRFTAREANQLLDRTGQTFWQPEAFDHWIRNDEEHARCCGYVRMNPVKAGLCAAAEVWRWSSVWRGEVPKS